MIHKAYYVNQIQMMLNLSNDEASNQYDEMLKAIINKAKTTPTSIEHWWATGWDIAQWLMTFEGEWSLDAWKDLLENPRKYTLMQYFKTRPDNGY